LQFTSDPGRAVAGCSAVFIAVGTPIADDGSADLTNVRDAAATIAKHLDGRRSSSTNPRYRWTRATSSPASCAMRALRAVPRRFQSGILARRQRGERLLPSRRIVIGCDDAGAEAFLRVLYAPLVRRSS